MTTSRPFVVALTWGCAVAAESLRLQAEEGVPGETAFHRALETFRYLCPNPSRGTERPRGRPTHIGPRQMQILEWLSAQQEPRTVREVADALLPGRDTGCRIVNGCLLLLERHGRVQVVGQRLGRRCAPERLWEVVPCQ